MAIISYIIAEDHKIFRKGLKDALQGDHRLKFAGEAANGRELLDILKTAKADVVLLDLNMPVMDGVDAAQSIRELYPKLKIIVLSMLDDEGIILKMLDMGVSGYLTKEVDPDEIINAIHAVVENQNYFSDKVGTAMLSMLVNKNKVRQDHKPGVVLSELEKDVLKLICKEHTNAEIADIVCRSSRTVEGIRSGMIEKIGVRNTAGLVIYALKNGFCE